MTTAEFTVATANLVDTPTANGLVTQADALLAPLLSHLIKGYSFTADDKSRQSQELRLTVTYSDGELAITDPFMVKAFTGRTLEEVGLAAGVFFAANPTFFFSPLQTQVLSNTARRSVIVYALVIYNESLADGASHYAGSTGGSDGGPPTGPAGGDLSGTYPAPIVGPLTTGSLLSGAIPAALTALDSRAIATYQDIEWELVLFKGNTRYSTTVRANIADGVTPEWSEVGITIAPPIGGTFDFTLDVDIVAGNMRLTVTPATVGWAARTRGRALAV